MNLETINTPSDLKEQNEFTDLQSAALAVAELNYGDARKLMELMMEANEALHKDLISQAMDEKDLKKVLNLTQDLTVLQTVRHLMERVS